MQAETAFSVVTWGVHLPWALLVFAPRWRWTQLLVHATLGALCLLHAVGVLTVPVPEGANAVSLAGAMRLHSEPWMALTAWVHYLAFDLFVGAWVARDAQRHRIPHLAVAPCIVLTLMFGPTGALLYLLLRGVMRRVVTLQETPAPAPATVAPEPLAGK